MSQQVFEKRISQFTSKIAELDKKLLNIALIRFAVLAIGAGLSFWFARENANSLLAIIPITILVFGFVVKWNMQVSREQEFFRILVGINEAELKRLRGDLKGFYPGTEYANVHHPYSADLDLFGDHSVFQLVNRAGTAFGRDTLAGWLSSPADAKTIQARQAAAQEMGSRVDWRQHLQAEGIRLIEGNASTQELRDWIQEPIKLPMENLLKLLPLVLAPLFILNIVAMTFGWISPYILLGQFALHLVVNWQLGGIGDEVYGGTEKRAGLIKAIGILLGKMEAGNWQSAYLRDLVNQLTSEGKMASAEIRSFSRILNMLEYRLDGNGHFIINTLLFWDIIWIGRMKAWKQRHADTLLNWFEVAGEFEATASIAAVHFAFPKWCFAEISEGDFQLVGQEVGHPLIPATSRVANPVDIQGRGQIMLITGSNMAGKSTYLRTIGINVVLALAGAPACARHMRLTSLQMVTSMRTLDSIEESTSSFYAELKRLKKVLEAVREEKHVLFLLDEILKGTNSRDRHAGAMALVRQLHAAGGSGMVSTHDLELADLAEELPGAVRNFSFNCEVSEENTLIFDYSLRDGVCESMNATQLMRGIGIDLEASH